MEKKTLREQQLEALLEAYNYLQKLLPSTEAIVAELRESRQADTDEYLNVIVNGINWIIEVLNRTLDIVNEEEEIIEKPKINNGIIILSNAIKEKDDLKIADAFEKDIIPFLYTLNSRVGVIVNTIS